VLFLAAFPIFYSIYTKERKWVKTFLTNFPSVADRFSARCQIGPRGNTTEKRNFSAIANVWESKDDIEGNFANRTITRAICACLYGL
jgi:hypothetical protein